MRSFSDVNLLVILLFVMLACVLWNIHETYAVAIWAYEAGTRLLYSAVGFVKHGA